MSLKIGFVYDLKSDYKNFNLNSEQLAEFDSEDTIHAIESTLQDLGYTVERIGNIFNLVNLLAQGKKWDLVFNIAEGLHGLAREAQVPALLDAYQIPYTFSSTETLIICHNKALAKKQIRDSGLTTAHYHLISHLNDLSTLSLNFPLFAKPVAEGTGKGVSQKSLVHTKQELEEVTSVLLADFKQPVLVEEYLPGREFTVGVVGGDRGPQVLGVLEVILKQGAEVGGHTYFNKENCETLVEYRLATDSIASEVGKLVLESWQALGIRDCARFDIRCNAQGVPSFIEVNPLAGLNPDRSDLLLLCKQINLPYKELIKRIVDSALNRYKIS